ncbi:neuropeptide FF receptor 2-like [Oculina patagonica]
MNGTSNSTATNPSIYYFIKPEVKVALYFCIFFLGLFGNALVVAVVARKRTTRTFHDIFILNLAVSDLLVVMIYFPLFFAYQLGQFKAPKTFCILIWPLITVAYLSSVFNITSMAVHRSRVIVNPYTSEMRRRSIYIWISIMWFVSFVCILPAMVFAEVSPVNGMCYDAWPSIEIQKAFRLFMLVVQYLLPLTITAVAYVRIGISINQSKAHKRSMQPRALSITRRRENMQVVRTIASIVIIFAVCMFPKHLASLYYYFGENSPKKAMILFRMLHFAEIFAVLHSCLNPLVYGTVMKPFRAEYMRYLKGIFCCRWNTRSGRIESSRAHTTNSVASRSSSNRTAQSQFAMSSLDATELATMSGPKQSEHGIVNHTVANEQVLHSVVNPETLL